MPVRKLRTHLLQYLWVNENVCIPMSQWKSDCFSAACPLWLFQVSSRQPKLNLLQSLAKPSKAWTGCYELICCKALRRSVLEETNCLAKYGRAWAEDVLSSKNHVPLLWRFLPRGGPGEAFLKKRTVWRSMAEPELGMFCHQRIMSRFRFLLCGGIFFCFTATISRHKYK